MKHLRIFNSLDEFKAVETSMYNTDIPFVVYEEGTKNVIYSNIRKITEDDITGGYYVDLGLPSGLKWATCNLGATKPCEYGLLYQFGRVDGYVYGDTNNHFRTMEQNSADTGSQYIPLTTSGKKYYAGNVLDPADDAAYVASNGAMRMPTKEEITELLDNTTNQWVSCSVMGVDHSSHEVMGRLFTSKTDSSKTLFFPAAGYFDGGNGSFSSSGSRGFFWSSSVHESNSDYGRNLFYSGGCYLSSNVRYDGFSVRGVFKNLPL